MKLHSGRIVLVVVLAVGAASAQDRVADESSSRIVLEGCLQPAERPNQSGSAPSSATTAVSDDGRTLPMLFFLTDARPAARAGAAAGAGASAGTAGQARTRNADGSVTTGADSQPPKTYALFGDSRELAVHGGHRVEVSGTIVRAPDAAGERGTAATSDLRPPPSGGPSAAPPNRATTADPPPGPVVAERLNVTSIRTVADACSR